MVGDSKPQMTSARVLSDDGDSILYAVQLSHGAEVALVLKTALELDLLEIIAEAGPGVHISPSEIARRLAAKNPNASVMLDRIMRLLAVYSILSCEERDLPDGRVERLYGLAPVCKYFIKNEDGVSLAMSCHLNQDRIALECWSHMKDAILEGGIPFERAHGKPTFVYAVTDPRVNTMVNKAMHHQSIFAMKKILETYTGFEDLKSLVDVGGGIGIVLNMIVSKYPSIHGINYDLPHVIAQAPSYPGVEHIGGDMFVSVPKAEAIFMKWVCHDWSDEDCVKLLKNCYDAVPADGKVMVCDLLLPQRLDTSLVTKNVVHLDVLMLAYNGGGKERTEEEFRALAKAAGFKGFRSVPSGALTCSVMEFLKN